MRAFIAMVAVISLVVDLSAQAQWTNLGVVSGGGYFAPACYESSRDRVMVQVHPQTWLFDGQSWSWAVHSPAPAYVKLVHDPRRGRTVAIEGFLRETWEWDGATWTLLPVVTPSAGLACYHAGRERVVAFTWNSASNTIGLSEWDGSAWTAIPSPNVLPNNAYVNLAYDIGRDKLVTFGPVVGGTYVPETWEWDATNGWMQVAAGGPPSLMGSSLVYDAARQRLVLLTWATHQSVTQTWERAGGAWTLQPTAQSVLRGWIVHDSHRSRCLIMNQDGFTWSYGVANPALYQPHGAGCPGSLGTPELSLTAPWSLPWLGSTHGITVDHLPVDIAVLAIGLQDQVSSAGPLPLNLSPLGAPGCFLRVAPDAATFLFGAGGTASWNLAIPPTNAFLGQRLFQQALSFDPFANALGAAMTNSMVGRIGGL